MALLFYSPDEDAQAWRRALLHRLPDLDFRAWPDTGDLAEIDAALVWRVPPGLLRTLPNLKAVLSLGAGVDAMLADPTLPELPLCRLIDRSLTRMMSEFVLLLVLKYHRGLDVYAAQQRQALWQFQLPPVPEATRVGILGLGELGADAARMLSAWLRGPRLEPHAKSDARASTDFAGRGGAGRVPGPDRHPGLPAAAHGRDRAASSMRACSRGCREGARLINVARGAHLVEADLLEALERGQLAHASLDVLPRRAAAARASVLAPSAHRPHPARRQLREPESAAEGVGGEPAPPARRAGRCSTSSTARAATDAGNMEERRWQLR